MQKDTEKLKINLEENLPEPSKWDMKEFSKFFNKEENDVKKINFLDGNDSSEDSNENDEQEEEKMYKILYFDYGKVDNNDKKISFIHEYYADYNKITRYDTEFDISKIREFEERIQERALKDSKNLGIDLNKELDLKEISKLKENFYSKISNDISIEEKKQELDDYSLKLMEIYFKVFRNKLFLDLTNESILPKNSKIYYSSIPFSKNVKTFKDHPVLFGYYKAWVDHCPISISPNIIWQLILNGIIKYIDINSEKLRHNFVNFKDGKKVITVDRSNININEATKEVWEGVIDEFSSKIKDNIKDNIYDNIILNFSTNTKELLLVQKISSMAMFSKYFEYGSLFKEVCGFPYIELEGSLEDWELILNKIKTFKKFRLKNWINNVEEILQKIIDSKKGKIDISFWKNLIMYRDCCRECGHPDPYISFSGWITNFFPFNNKGKDYYHSKIEIYNVEKDDPMSEIVVTPLKIHLIDTNRDIDLNIYSGLLCVSQDPKTLCVKPELGFLITEKCDKSNKLKNINFFEEF